MDTLTVRPTTWRGLPAWRVDAAKLSLVVTEFGGHLAALWDRRDSLNPFWQPPWPSADPGPVVEGGVHGSGPETKLLATIVGHNWCCDRFGAAWPGEKRPLHGEVAIERFAMSHTVPDRVSWTAWLPETRLRVRKTIAINGDHVEMVHAVSHDEATAREIEWCEHVNIGDPFLAGVEFAAGVERMTNWPKEAEPGSRFAHIAPEGDVPIAQALAMPRPDAPACGDVLCGRLAQGWFTATNRTAKRRLTYRWDARQYPWLVLWTQHKSRTAQPWNGRTRSRGMEFSTKPWPEGKPPASRAVAYQGRSAVCRVPPGAWREHGMVISWEKV